MSYYAPKTHFSGKTWIYFAQALVFGFLAIFSFIFGPLFLFEIMKNARGEPARDAGVALTLMSVPMLLVFALAVFNILARRRPLICLCREGLAINMIGASSLDGIPMIPGMIRIAWLILSFQGFKQQMLIAPWHSVKFTHVSGLPMARTLTIVGSFFQSTDREVLDSTAVANQLTFPEVAFDMPLDQIAATINAYCQNPETRKELLGLDATAIVA